MEFYTQLEKIEKMIEIKTQLQVYGLSNHENMKKFDEIVQKYVKDGEEFTGKIKLHGTNRMNEYKI